MTRKEALCELWSNTRIFPLRKAWLFLSITDKDGVYENDRVKITKTGDEKYDITWK